MKPPPLWRLTRLLPYAWKIALLKALAWPEFRVERYWFTADAEGRPTVERQPINAGSNTAGDVEHG